MGSSAAKGLELGLPVVLHVLQGPAFHDRQASVTLETIWKRMLSPSSAAGRS